MNRQTKTATIQTLLRAAAELAADIAGELSEASGAAEKGETLQAIGTIIGTPDVIAQLDALVSAAMALNRAKEAK